MLIILFDIDGTLVRTGGAGKAAMEAALCEDFGVQINAEEVPYSGRTDRAIGRDLLAAHGIEPNETNRQRLTEGYLARLPEYLGRFPGRICPGIPDLLRTLQQQQDVLLGLLTGNIRRGAEKKLAHYGLWHAFTVGGFGDEHDDRDDVARSALHSVNEHVGKPLDPTQIWVIGDTPLDVKCARAIGAKAVAVATGWHRMEDLQASEPDYVFADLSNPAELLAAWQSA